MGRIAPAVAIYEPRDPSHTVLYRVIAEHLETFLTSCAADPDAQGLPAYVQREFYDYLQCGILAHGFLRLGCDTCKREVLLAFSCKRRGFCPSCAGRRMTQTAAHLVDRVIPWVPTRQWVVSVPMPLRYWMSSSKDLTGTVHTIIHTTIAQYYINQAVKRGVERQKVQANTQVPAHRRDQLERLLRYTGRGAVSLERLEEDAHGDLVYSFTKPWSDGTTGRKLSPLELLEKLAAIVPLPRVHLVRYAGCLAPHSQLRGAIIPTPRQQGVGGDEANTGTPRWSWVRMLRRVFDLDMATCPLCRRGVLRIIAAITHEAVITRILRHLNLASVPPPIAPARSRQETFDWVASCPRRRAWSQRRRARRGGGFWRT